MCLAVYKPAGVLPDWDAYAEGFRCNSHGAGFAVVHDGNLIISKGFFTFDAFRDAFAPVSHLQAAVHFRLATHGNKDADNCHPFLVTDGLALIHNGILDIECNEDATKSDTWHYAQLVLRPMAERDPDFFDRPEVMFLGGAAIRDNKFVFLRGDGKYAIWNESAGHWADDCWFSNRSYVEPYWFRQPVKRIGYYVEKEDSEYRDFLSGEAAWAYDDLLSAGYEPRELDQIIREEGHDGLIQWAEEMEEEYGDGACTRDGA